LKKPKKKEFSLALIICLVLFSAIIYTTTFRSTEHYGGLTTLEPRGLSNPEALTQQYGLSGLTGLTTPTSSAESERVKDIRQWIKGELKKGTFEEVVTNIEAETENFGGYVDSEDVAFSDDIWSGELVSKIPQNNSLQFVFKARNLISSNGKVTSITTNIKDITPTSGTITAKPLATIRIALKEIIEKPNQPGLPPIELPFIATIVPYLGTFFTWVITGIIIGLPTYFTVLGIVLLINRALIPLANKILKKV
jgi:hypothetical protein